MSRLRWIATKENTHMKIPENLSQYISKVSDHIKKLFNKEELDLLAKETGFVQRSTSKIEGSDLVELMTTEMLYEPRISYEGLCERLSKINSKANISTQALEQRINSEGAVNYLYAVLKQAVEVNLKPMLDEVSSKQMDSELLTPFARVFIEDSTQGSLHEKLASEFKGSGGSASPAAIKIDLVYEYKQNAIHELLISKGTKPDQASAWNFLDKIQKTDLLIRDLGYFELSSIEQIFDLKAFLLSRLLKSVDVYLNKDDEKPLNLPKYLNENYKNDNVIDIDIYLGKKERLFCRLIVYRAPQETVRIRRYQARQNASKKGRRVSQDYLDWLEFSFFVTNVPRHIWSASVIGTIYRLRWQIELIFKQWKSLLSIDVLKGMNPLRIKCIIYGRLIAVVAITCCCAVARTIAQCKSQREISFTKVIQWLLRKGRLTDAIWKGNLFQLLLQLIDDIGRLCKQKRKRKTTAQLIEEQIDYMDGFT